MDDRGDEHGDLRIARTTIYRSHGERRYDRSSTGERSLDARDFDYDLRENDLQRDDDDDVDDVHDDDDDNDDDDDPNGY